MEKVSMSHEDYLEAIVMLGGTTENSVRSVDIANKLGVSKASVNKAMNALKEKGFADQPYYGDVTLTEDGYRYGAAVLERHSGFAVAAFALGFALRIDAPSWLAIVICIGAVMLFQKGTFLIGAQRAAILSTFEPITSIFVGILFLNETLTPRILLGSAITLVAGVFITLGSKKDEGKEEAAKD